MELRAACPPLVSGLAESLVSGRRGVAFFERLGAPGSALGGGGAQPLLAPGAELLAPGAEPPAPPVRMPRTPRWLDFRSRDAFARTPHDSPNHRSSLARAHAATGRRSLSSVVRRPWSGSSKTGGGTGRPEPSAEAVRRAPWLLRTSSFPTHTDGPPGTPRGEGDGSRRRTGELVILWAGTAGMLRAREPFVNARSGHASTR